MMLESRNQKSEEDAIVFVLWSVHASACGCMCAAHIVSCRFVLSGSLDSVSQEAKNGADPQQDGEATKQLTTELDPLWSCGRRSEGVGTIPEQELSCLGIGQALKQGE